jgi:hypothetical protein
MFSFCLVSGALLAKFILSRFSLETRIKNDSIKENRRFLVKYCCRPVKLMIEQSKNTLEKQRRRFVNCEANLYCAYVSQIHVFIFLKKLFLFIFILETCIMVFSLYYGY